MTVKLASAFNDELEKSGLERLKIIVPLVYGEKQKRILEQESLLSDELILDPELGMILQKAFYGNETFEQYLSRWVNNFETISAEANAYLTDKYGKDIAIEVNRSPRVLYSIAPAYFSSFGLLSRVFEESTKISDIKIDKGLLVKAAAIHKKIEQSQKIKCVGYPGLFPENAILVPPIAPMTENDFIKHQNDPAPNKTMGIFITKTGIPGLERLYNESHRLGLYPYDNEHFSTNLISSNAISFHFARSGWGSVWRSLISEKPLIVPEYDAKDDPEIYFNNLKIEKSGIGMIYKEGGLKEVIDNMDKMDEIKIAQQKINREIKERWGTLDGTKFAAGIFAKDFLSA